MSRDYKVQIEVAPRFEKERAAEFQELLADEFGYELDDVCDSYINDNATIFNGMHTLSGGRSEYEAHDRLVEKLGEKGWNVQVITRWHCVDFQEWDAEIGDISGT